MFITLIFACTVLFTIASVFYFVFALSLFFLLLTCLVSVFGIVVMTSACFKVRSLTIRDWLWLLVIPPCLWWYDVLLCLGSAVMLLALLLEYIFDLTRHRETCWPMDTNNPRTTTSASGMYVIGARYSLFHLFKGPMLSSSSSCNSCLKHDSSFVSDSSSPSIESSYFTTSLSSSTVPSVSSYSDSLSAPIVVRAHAADSSSTMDALSTAMETLNLVDSSNVSVRSYDTACIDTSLLVHGGDMSSFSACRCSGSGRTSNGVCSCLGHTCSGAWCACSRGGGARDLRRLIAGGVVTGLASIFGSSWDGGLISPWLWYQLADIQYRLSSLSLGNNVDPMIPGVRAVDVYNQTSSGFDADVSSKRSGVAVVDRLRL